MKTYKEILEEFSLESEILKKAINKKFVLIAEIGVNYYDIATKLNITPMEAAKLMIKEAKNVGIHAVKFQTYKADTLAVKESPSYRSEEHTSELQSRFDLVCRLLLEKKKKKQKTRDSTANKH